MRIVAFFLSLLLFDSVFAQKKYTLSGTVKDASNGETIIGGIVYVIEKKTGVTTNAYGFYSIQLPEGKYTVQYSLMGYETKSVSINLDKDTRQDVELSEAQAQLREVEISSEREDASVKSVEMSVQKLDIKTINKIPALLGEVDVMRSIQLLPGVTTVGEGASGFNVRGGGIDQNLILLDEAPVYNSSHLFGFFSVFNPDAVKDVKLVKGGIPAQYGGRLSSLLDVRMKDGNSKRLEVNGGIGTIFSRLTVEGPIIKERCSFIVGGRRSYFDLAFPFARNPDIQKAIAYFYDFTAKFNYVLNDKNRLYLSGYFGRDRFGTGGRNGFSFDWGNATTTIRWNRVYNSKLFSNVSFIYSNYDYKLGVGDNFVGFSWKSNTVNYSVKPEFNFYPNSNNTITFGATTTYYNFDPGILIFYSQGEKRERGDRPKYTLENAVYVANEQKLGPRFSTQYGLRTSNFNYLGPGTAYYFRDTNANAPRDTLYSRNFRQNEIIKQYNYFEPRIGMKYEVTEFSSVKASYNRMVQYLHLISNTAASTPLDVWMPATNNLKPQLADQVALGYFHNLKILESYFESSVEVYYKKLQNQVDYIDGANLLLNKLLEGELLNGIGRAYGAEFYLRKVKGKLTGWLSYTFSRSERRVNFINNNQWFPNRFDKPHNLNLVTNYDASKRISFSINFVYASGTPATFPTNRIEWQGYIIPHNVDAVRNNVRIPPYHRLDLSVQYNFKKKFRDRFESYIVLSVYNAYARRNPFGIYFRPNGGAPLITEAVKFSVIGRAIPSLTYNFKF